MVIFPAIINKPATNKIITLIVFPKLPLITPIPFERTILFKNKHIFSFKYSLYSFDISFSNPNVLIEIISDKLSFRKL